MLYERLNLEMRRTVDVFVLRLQTLPWQYRTSLLAEASASFEGQFQGTAAELAARGFLTAVLERLDDAEEVDDPDRAHLLSLSLNPHHRSLADRYFAENPDEVRLKAEPEPERAWAVN